MAPTSRPPFGSEHQVDSGQPLAWPHHPRILAALVLALTLVGTFGASGASAETDTESSEGIDPSAEEAPDPEAEAAAEQLRQGARVYSQVCSSCHQPGGVGLPGEYPPLLGNPAVDDAEYVANVIENGREGRIEVLGEVYDEVMPSVSTLPDDDVAAVIAYVQNDFQAPVDESAAAEPTGPVAGSELPALANMGAVTSYLLAAAVAALILAPHVVGANDRLNTPWLDAWLKTAVIVVATTVLVVVIPDRILKWGPVSELGRFSQDFIGTTMWGLGVLVMLGGLWYAHRESRV